MTGIKGERGLLVKPTTRAALLALAVPVLVIVSYLWGAR